MALDDVTVTARNGQHAKFSPGSVEPAVAVTMTSSTACTLAASTTGAQRKSRPSSANGPSRRRPSEALNGTRGDRAGKRQHNAPTDTAGSSRKRRIMSKAEASNVAVPPSVGMTLQLRLCCSACPPTHVDFVCMRVADMGAGTKALSGWTCLFCTFTNHRVSSHCDACSAEKPPRSMLPL